MTEVITEPIVEPVIETVSKVDFDSLQAELDEVKGKLPKEKSEGEIALETKQQELFAKEVAFELKQAGLEQFASLIKVSDTEELTETIKTLSQVVSDIKASTGYVPNEHLKQDAYASAEQKKDVQGMLSSKLANLFK